MINSVINATSLEAVAIGVAPWIQVYQWGSDNDPRNHSSSIASISIIGSTVLAVVLAREDSVGIGNAGSNSTVGQFVIRVSFVNAAGSIAIGALSDDSPVDGIELVGAVDVTC